MPVPLFLLLTLLLGPGSWEARAMETPGPLLTWDQRQLPENENSPFDFNLDDDYEPVGTDPPETLEPLTLMRMMEQSSPAGPGTPEPVTVEPATDGPGAGGTDTGAWSTDLATQDLPSGLVTVTPSTVEAPSTAGDVSTKPASTEALPTEHTSTEALPTEPATMEVLPTTPAATTEALPTEPATTETLHTTSAATEALPTEPATTETLFTAPATMKALPTEPATTEIMPMTSVASEASTKPNVIVHGQLTTMMSETTHSETPSHPTTSLPQSNTSAIVNRSVDIVKHWRFGPSVTPRSSVNPSPTGLSNSIPVKQCLLAILILALVATIFLVCTVVLAIRLSRKNHTYPVRSYSPREMVCISSLLPDRGEGPTPATANGGPPNTAKGQGEGQGEGGKVEPEEEREGEDLTLHSFLP